MPKFISNILDKIIPGRVEFREEEKERAAARAARKEELRKAKKERVKMLEWIDNKTKADTIVNTDEDPIEQLALETHWVKKALNCSKYHPVNIQSVEGQPRMYEVEIVPPRMFTKLKTHVYVYVECRGTKDSATVFMYIPAMLGQEEEFKAMAFYNGIDMIQLKEDTTIEMAWRIFSTLFEDQAA